MDRARNKEFREKLDTLLSDWSAEVAAVVDRLATAESERDELRDEQQDFENRMQALSDRADGQSELIDVLRAEAEEAHTLSATVREQDQEIVRLKSEIESKQELVRALRRDADGVDRLKAEIREKNDIITALKADVVAAEGRADALEARLTELSEASADDTAGDQAELAALRTELEARKTLIRSLRDDAERVPRIESELDSKREIILQLEKSINNHVETIAGLRRNAEMWRRKCQTLRGASTSDTSTELPAFTSTDVAAMQQLAEVAGDAPDRTVAIDVRGPLREARKARKRADVNSR
jgi:chromosome segregation ATPase